MNYCLFVDLVTSVFGINTTAEYVFKTHIYTSMRLSSNSSLSLGLFIWIILCKIRPLTSFTMQGTELLTLLWGVK